MWKIKGSISILLLAYSMRLSDGAFIPFEEDELEERGTPTISHLFIFKVLLSSKVGDYLITYLTEFLISVGPY